VYRRVFVPQHDLWLRDLTRGTEQRLTNSAPSNVAPFWSPKGDRIVFASSRSGTLNLYQKAANGTGKDELLLANGNFKHPTQWSRDGKFIVYSENDPKTRRDIWVLPIDGGTQRKPIPFLRSEFNEFQGQLSPDSHWMAYTSDKTGQREVYVVAFPTGESEARISIDGGEQPRWRGDGKELFFIGADAKMMVVAVKAVPGKPSFEPGAPQPLFEARLARAPSNPLFEYDVTRDGKRFLLNTTGIGSTSAPFLNVVVNWDAGLKK
jgi:Tol biopolymer transport system component